MRGAALALVAVLLAAAAMPQPGWRWKLPAGIAPPPLPADNAMSAAKVALGRRLFYDADLSADGTMSCATCHEQKRGFANANATMPGVHGDAGRRNVPGLANIGWARTLTWADPRLTTLEAQVLVPVQGEHPIEMGMNGKEAEIARRLGGDACYRTMFRAAFPASAGRIALADIARALAAFERTLASHDSPCDRYRRGAAMPAAAAAGAATFLRACAGCHAGTDLSDGGFHAIAPLPAAAADRGLAEATGLAADAGRFRTPSLRNVALTAPYLHDGSAPTLAAAIRRHAIVPASALDDAAVAALGAYLATLTDRSFVTDRRFALPDRACGRRL